MSIEAWNQRYLAGEQLDEAPAALVQQFAAPLAPGVALDLACGPGRHAVYLAERGWRVTAVDGSAIAIDLLRERARERRLSIDARLADLERGEFEIPAGVFDLIVQFRYLQRDLIPAMQCGLRPSGMVIAVVLLSDAAPTPVRAAPGELQAYFAGWRLLHSLEANGVAELVAIKT